MTEHFYLGVDGGGTHTTSVVTDATGHVLGRGDAGPSHVWLEGAETAQHAVRASIAAAYEEAGVRGRARAACLALASCPGPAPADAHWLDLARVVVVDHDAWASLVAVLGTTKPGVVAQAGTGSVVLGRTPEGERTSAGGWGPLVGDNGSAYGIGTAGFRAATNAVDNTGPKTLLVDAIARAWHQSWDGIVEHLYRPGHRQRLASLAPLVVSMAAEDDVAHRVVTQQIEALAREVAAVVRTTHATCGTVDIVLAGGVVHPPTAVTPLLQSAAERLVDHEIRWHQGADAAEGAAILARLQEAPDGQ